MTRTRQLAAVVMVAAALTSCGSNKNNTDRDKVLRFLAATRAVARAFTYQDTPLSGASLDLVGVVEDDYRYKVRFSVNGNPVREEVAVDDALAVRFVDPSALGPSIDPDGLRKAEAKAAKAEPPKPGVESIPALPLDTLKAGRWVVDPVGAPSLAIRSGQRNTGLDPVLDALTVLDYTTEVVRGSQYIAKFNPDALDPTYKGEEDHFDKPELGADVTRYDVPLVDLPRAAVAGGPKANFVPEANNFRKLAIFVKDGKVIRIDEDIDIPSRIKDFKKAFDISGDLRPEDTVAAINEVRKARGRKDLLRPRRMVVSFPDLGAPTDTIELPPPDEYTKGELSLLRGRGRLSARDRANAANAAAAGAAPDPSASTVPPTTAASGG